MTWRSLKSYAKFNSLISQWIVKSSIAALFSFKNKTSDLGQQLRFGWSPDKKWLFNRNYLLSLFSVYDIYNLYNKLQVVSLSKSQQFAEPFC